jgi:Rieske Fe-S protein
MVRNLVSQGVNFTKGFVKAHVTKADETPVSELSSGEARVLQVDGQKVAAYRDDDGTLHTVSAICAHLGCLVDWNDEARTWDCPCHGSRYDFDGHVIHGPAKKDLEPR